MKTSLVPHYRYWHWPFLGGFWPYFAGGATFVVGLLFLDKEKARRAQNLEKFVLFGPVLVAIAMAIFGADHFTAAKYVAMIVPPWMPWRLFWVYFVGLGLLASAFSLATRVHWRLASAMLGTMILYFVLFIHFPNWLRDPHSAVRLTIFLRDVALSAGALAFAVPPKPLQEIQRDYALSRIRFLAPRLITIMRFLVAASVGIFGIAHFLNLSFAPGIPQENPSVLVTMPAWIPGHAFWAYVTGALFLLCARYRDQGLRAHRRKGPWSDGRCVDCGCLRPLDVR